MNQKPIIKFFHEKKLIGQHIHMSLTENRTVELWQHFMPRKKEIINPIGTELYSIELFDTHYFSHFKLETIFDKWAAIEVSDFNSLPDGMEKIIIPSGLYAVFEYKGSAHAGALLYEYIFNVWLPGSDYTLDNRPHFAIMGENYKNNDPDSEEEICIPVIAK